MDPNHDSPPGLAENALVSLSMPLLFDYVTESEQALSLAWPKQTALDSLAITNSNLV